MVYDMQYLFFVVFLYVAFKEVTCCVNYKRNPFLSETHIAALILARGGSKGIQLKNIQKVGNKTLLGRALEQTKLANFSSVWVSTDNSLIYNDAEKYNVNIHWRSPATATDQALSIFAAQEFLEKHSPIDILALIQCTSPFIKREYLERAVDLVKDSECVFSVSRSAKLRWKKENKNLLPINFDPKHRPRRQNLQQEFVENGMFYLSRRKLIETGRFQTNSCQFVQIPQFDDWEVDTQFDLILANMILNITL